ncbi:MAG TPA: glycosyltransferase family 1 protein [Thermoflexus sp.]|nr:glycosyltransferase family 1 protein [Thermoflexus sp.]
MIRIGLDARLLAYRREGIARYILELATRLPRVIDDPEIRLLIFQSRKDPNARVAAPNTRTVYVWTPPHHRWEQRTWPLEVAIRRVSLLHSPDFIPPFSGSFHRVITIHDLHFLKYPDFMTMESRRYYAGQIEKAVRLADHIIAVSQTTRADLMAYFGLPSDRVSVVYEGASEVYRPLPSGTIEETLGRLGLKPGYILFVGTWEPRKNLPMLLRAYARLLDRRPEAPPLVLAGRRGWLYQEILEWPHRLHITDRLRWVEGPDDLTLAALYNGAAFLVFPSLYEGFGLPALEAMACGTPVIVSDRGALPEVVGDAGLILPAEEESRWTEAMEALLEDAETRERMRRKGQERAALFSWDRAAAETWAIYRRVLGR